MPLKKKRDDDDEYGDEDESEKPKKKKTRFKTYNTAEAFVPLIHFLLPTMEILMNKHTKSFNTAKKRKIYTKDMKMLEIKKIRDVPDIAQMVQDVLAFWERNGGILAYVTIKKMIPKYESCVFV